MRCRRESIRLIKELAPPEEPKRRAKVAADAKVAPLEGVQLICSLAMAFDAAAAAAAAAAKQTTLEA